MSMEQDILELAIRALQSGLGIQIHPGKRFQGAQGDGADGTGVISIKGAAFDTTFVIKRTLHPAMVGYLAELKRHFGGRLMLVTSHVTNRYAATLAVEGIDFVDTAGNFFFQRGKVLVFITGRKPDLPVLAYGSGRAFESNGLKLIFALLTDPQLDSNDPSQRLINQPYRKISAITGISLGSVGWIMSDLANQGYVMDRSDGDRRLVERRRLIERWVAGFASKLRRKLITTRYRSSRSLWWEQADVRKAGGLWGGEVGGAKLTGYLTPGTVTIYTEKLVSDFIVEHDLRPDPAGNVTIMKAFWGERTWAVQQDCVHPLLVYADLTASEIDRNLETARRVYDRYLKATIESA